MDSLAPNVNSKQYKHANKKQLTFILFMEQVYFWLSVMVKIEIGG